MMASDDRAGGKSEKPEGSTKGGFLKLKFKSQKILENFYISNINTPNHYPEQKIRIYRLKQ